jgi:D-alanyl-D-alanine carboxypeptidase/Putative peptidoglycan binding domain
MMSEHTPDSSPDGGPEISVELQEWDGETAPEGTVEACEGSEYDQLEAVVRSAQSRGWGPGWPHCQTDKLSTVVVISRIRLSVRREIAPLGAWLCRETIGRGYQLRSGQCWGFACRSIRGSSSPSNHSWGLAVDLNSLTNPMGSRLVTDMPRWLPELWTEHGYRWGGTYSGRKDAMHFEYLGTPDSAAATISRLGAHPAAHAAATLTHAAAAAPGRPAPPFPLPDGHYVGTADDGPHSHSGSQASDRPEVRRFQSRLVERGWDLGKSGADGLVGRDTRAAVVGFQKEKDLEADGRVGPKTWTALLAGSDHAVKRRSRNRWGDVWRT